MKYQVFLRGFILTAIFLCLITPSVLAQKTAGEAGGKSTSPKYDFATEVKLKGTVDEVRLVPGPDEGTHVLLRTGADTILIHVAPPEFLKEFEFPVNKGDQIQVIGSKLKIDNQDEVLAKEITRGDSSVTLRDKKGVPVWALWPKK